MATLFQPTREVKREGNMQIKKLLNSRSLESHNDEIPARKRPRLLCMAYCSGLQTVFHGTLGFNKAYPGAP
ncbi:hypothetical protein TNCV_4745001 [Trichonephila clavipes]|nr:hypothetical protein TNCV_4745001 [Trichonephila clavipes]